MRVELFRLGSAVEKLVHKTVPDESPEPIRQDQQEGETGRNKAQKKEFALFVG